jgi:hypothetical protein
VRRGLNGGFTINNIPLMPFVQGNKKKLFVICVEDYHKLIRTQFLIQSPLGNLMSGLTKNVACLSSLFIYYRAVKRMAHQHSLLCIFYLDHVSSLPVHISTIVLLCHAKNLQLRCQRGKLLYMYLKDVQY